MRRSKFFEWNRTLLLSSTVSAHIAAPYHLEKRTCLVDKRSFIGEYPNLEIAAIRRFRADTGSGHIRRTDIEQAIVGEYRFLVDARTAAHRK